MDFLEGIADRLPLLLTATPALGTLWVWFQSRRGLVAARQAAVVNSSLTLVVAALMVWQQASAADAAPRGMMIPWFHAGPIRVAWAFGVDGISLWPLCALAVIGWTTVLVAERCCSQWTAGAYGGLLCGQALGMGLFAAQDFTLFLLCSEGWAWWAFVMVGTTGGNERQTAAQRFLLVSSLANSLWGIAGIGLAACQAWIRAEVQNKSSGISLLYADILGTLQQSIHSHEIPWGIWSTFQPWILLLWLAGLWLRWPIFPLHGWWLSLMTQARAPVAAVCGATTLLQSGYVLFRFVIPLCAPVGTVWAQAVIFWAGLGVLLAGLLAVSQSDLRRLASNMALGALSVTFIAGMTGSVLTSLVCWQMLIILALTVASAWLLMGRIEAEYQTTDLLSLSGLAFVMPRCWTLLALSLGLMAAIPALSLVSGQMVPVLLELARWGWPNLFLLIGGLLGSWAVVRALVQIGFGPTQEPARDERTVAVSHYSPNRDSALPTVRIRMPDLRLWELTIGGLVCGALCLGLAPSFWWGPIRPAWERMHDPFSEVTAAAGTSPRDSGENATKFQRQETRKPTDRNEGSLFLWPAWGMASTTWLLGGLALLLAPRVLPKFTGAPLLAFMILFGGLVAELGWQWESRNQAGSLDAWRQSIMWSLAVLGLAAITGERSGIDAKRGARDGSWLLRLGALGWTATSNHLIICGLAWELAEFARNWKLRSSNADSSQISRESVRQVVSSACFWLGGACCFSAAGSVNFDQWALQFSAEAAQPLSAVGFRLGLVGMILMISAIGCRCGLFPWSLGRGDRDDLVSVGDSLLDQWLEQLLGLVLVLQVVLAMNGSLSGTILVILSIGGGGTALWAGASSIDSGTIKPLLRKLLTTQFAGLVVLTATLAAGVLADAGSGQALLSSKMILIIWAAWVLTMSVTVTGLVVILRRLGGAESSDPFFENYRGLIKKRPWEACVLAVLLAGVATGLPAAGFWPHWLSGIAVVMTPHRIAEGALLPNGVLLCAATSCLVGQFLQLTVLVRWVRCLLFDSPVSLPEGSGRRLDLILSLAAAAVCLAVGWQPAILFSFWLGSTH